ncbi:MoaD family protein [candidate division KSB1 bacterium]|nr:MoaD family protein [candidate division KSB1 bacterium]
MSVEIIIPLVLRQYAENRDSVKLSGQNIGELLDNLMQKFPNMKKHLFSEDGQIRNFVNVYVNDDDIRYLENSETQLKEGDVISIIPSVAGG